MHVIGFNKPMLGNGRFIVPHIFMWSVKFPLQGTLEYTSQSQAYLGADTRCGHTEGHDGDILGSVQPVNSQFCACGPLHHRHIVLAVI